MFYLDHSEETLLIVDVFHIFEEELKEQSNENNRYFLHGVLKHYYGEERAFYKGTDKRAVPWLDKGYDSEC